MAKGLAEAVLVAAGVAWWTEPGARPFLHPGRSASVYAGADRAHGHEVGWIGELHPGVAEAWDLGRAAAFELDAGSFAELGSMGGQFEPIVQFPAVRQDVAVVVPREVPADHVEQSIRAGAGPLLESVRLFDLYSGEQIGPEEKSLALTLEFRHAERTLADAPA